MREVFYEECAKVKDEAKARRKYVLLKSVSIVFYVLAALWTILVFYAYDFGGEGSLVLKILFVAMPLVYFIFSGIIFGKFKNGARVDYDYTIVSGTVRFSKVMNDVKRKHITSFDCSAIERIGKYGSDTFNRYSAMPNKKLDVLTSNFKTADAESLYYIVANVSGIKHVFVLECTERFIINILTFVNRTVMEDGFLR